MNNSLTRLQEILQKARKLKEEILAKTEVKEVKGSSKDVRGFTTETIKDPVNYISGAAGGAHFKDPKTKIAQVKDDDARHDAMMGRIKADREKNSPGAHRQQKVKEAQADVDKKREDHATRVKMEDNPDRFKAPVRKKKHQKPILLPKKKEEDKNAPVPEPKVDDKVKAYEKKKITDAEAEKNKPKPKTLRRKAGSSTSIHDKAPTKKSKAQAEAEAKIADPKARSKALASNLISQAAKDKIKRDTDAEHDKAVKEGDPGTTVATKKRKSGYIEQFNRRKDSTDKKLIDKEERKVNKSVVIGKMDLNKGMNNGGLGGQGSIKAGAIKPSIKQPTLAPAAKKNPIKQIEQVQDKGIKAIKMKEAKANLVKIHPNGQWSMEKDDESKDIITMRVDIPDITSAHDEYLKDAKTYANAKDVPKARRAVDTAKEASGRYSKRMATESEKKELKEQGNKHKKQAPNEETETMSKSANGQWTLEKAIHPPISSGPAQDGKGRPIKHDFKFNDDQVRTRKFKSGEKQHSDKGQKQKLTVEDSGSKMGQAARRGHSGLIEGHKNKIKESLTKAANGQWTLEKVWEPNRRIERKFKSGEKEHTTFDEHTDDGEPTGKKYSRQYKIKGDSAQSSTGKVARQSKYGKDKQSRDQHRKENPRSKTGVVSGASYLDNIQAKNDKIRSQNKAALKEWKPGKDDLKQSESESFTKAANGE